MQKSRCLYGTVLPLKTIERMDDKKNGRMDGDKQMKQEQNGRTNRSRPPDNMNWNLTDCVLCKWSRASPYSQMHLFIWRRCYKGHCAKAAFLRSLSRTHQDTCPQHCLLTNQMKNKSQLKRSESSESCKKISQSRRTQNNFCACCPGSYFS